MALQMQRSRGYNDVTTSHRVVNGTSSATDNWLLNHSLLVSCPAERREAGRDEWYQIELLVRQWSWHDVWEIRRNYPHVILILWKYSSFSGRYERTERELLQLTWIIRFASINFSVTFSMRYCEKITEFTQQTQSNPRPVHI